MFFPELAIQYVHSIMKAHEKDHEICTVVSLKLFLKVDELVF
jgi:hypothetical protein